MDLTGALALGRFVRDGAAFLLWGGSVFLLLTPPRLRARLATTYARWSLATILTLAATVLALLPVQAAALGEGWPDAFDPGMLGALLSGTSIGTAWLIQGAAATVLLLVPMMPGPWRIGTVAVGSAVLLASLTLTGHAAMHEGWLGLAHRANALCHLLAGGFWLGALLPLHPTLGLLRDPARHDDAIVALRRFSRLGHGAVALVLITGILNTMLILGRRPSAWASLYEGLLVAKILLVATMTALALLNRYALVPRLRDRPDRTIRSIRRATLAEVGLGMGAIALVALFGLLDPA